MGGGGHIHKAEVSWTLGIIGHARQEVHDTQIHSVASNTSQDTTDDEGIHAGSSTADSRSNVEDDRGYDVKPFCVEESVQFSKRQHGCCTAEKETIHRAWLVDAVSGNVGERLTQQTTMGA